MVIYKIVFLFLGGGFRKNVVIFDSKALTAL